jgi:uncharacterized membrane protein YcaP (DUF421 family)
MGSWLETDWGRLFTLEMSLPEILLRGTLVYVALVLLLRIILKRQCGKLSLSDPLVVTLVAGVCRNPLVRDSYSIPDGLLVVSVVLFWSYACDWLSYHSPFLHKVLHPPPVLLIRDGVVLQENLRRELMTPSQLRQQLRLKGILDCRQVAEAWIEGDGHISAVRKDEAAGQHSPEIAPADESHCEPGEESRSHDSRAAAVQEPCLCAGQAEEEDVQAFLRAAAKLQEQLAWHHERAAAIRQLLSQHGCRLKTQGSRTELR